MRCTDLVAVATAAAWRFLAAVGTDLQTALAARRVAGYPDQAQMVLYVGAPVFCLVAVLCAIVLSRKTRWFHRAYPFVVGSFVIALLPTVFLWGGGV